MAETMNDVPAGLAASPAWFPHMLDPDNDNVLLVGMDEADYRAASFLDQRALRPGMAQRIVRWRDLAAALPEHVRRDAHFIFHIGHVGSTLISRLLGELPGAFALREPLLLRTFAEMPVEWAAPRTATLTAFLSRTWRPEQRAVVKATSFTSEFADRLLPAESRALFLFARPQHYVENILAGPNSRQELQLLSPARIERLRSRCPGLAWDLPGLSEARKAALGWACEMTSLERSAAVLPAQSVMWLDFDRFLADPAPELERVAAFFGQALDRDTARALLSGPIMRRYSKAPEYEYSAELRRDLLAQARWEHGAAIRDALLWLEEAGRRYPAVAQAIRRAH